MKLPKKSAPVLKFKHGETWYQITTEGDKYVLYRQDSEKDYTMLGTGNNPVKLENRVYDGKVK